MNCVSSIESKFDLSAVKRLQSCCLCNSILLICDRVTVITHNLACKYMILTYIFLRLEGSLWWAKAFSCYLQFQNLQKNLYNRNLSKFTIFFSKFYFWRVYICKPSPLTWHDLRIIYLLRFVKCRRSKTTTIGLPLITSQCKTTCIKSWTWDQKMVLFLILLLLLQITYLWTCTH